MQRYGFILILICLFVSISYDTTIAQCCSPGNPVAGAASVGTVPKKKFRSITFFRHSFSDTYYEGNKVSEMQGVEANFNYIGEIIGYGLFKRLTIEGEFGYFINKTKKDTVMGTQETKGLYNGVISLKYCLLKSKNDWEITVGSGFKFPFTRTPIVGEYDVPLPEDIQPSTNATGFVAQLYVAKSYPKKKFGVILINRYEINGRNENRYRFGNAFYSSLFISKGFLKRFTGLLQIRNENRAMDVQGDIDFTSSGSNVVFMAPMLTCRLPRDFNVTTYFDFPVNRNYEGLQLGPKYAFGVSLLRQF
jgi:hypothetical protein